MPLGIGELKRLQTLNKIIVGGENGIAITGLRSLKNLQGKISILGLGNVQNAMEAHEANLAQKRLSELELDWGNVSSLFRREAHEKEVLNVLKPHNDTLKELKIVSYGGIEFPNWVGDQSFFRLTKVSIDGCEECTSLPRLGQLPSLKELLICGMTKVKTVDLYFLGTGIAFPSLEVLRFKEMPEWEVWSTNNNGVVHALFPCLQVLSIESCHKLVQVTFEALPSLRFLQIIKCGHVVLKSLLDVASSVSKLEINGISGLTDELWRGVIGNLGVVEEISIQQCNEIRYLWEYEAEASMVLANLRKLDVYECSNLVSLGENEEDNFGNNLTTVRSLNISYCNNFQHCSFPKSIESLGISDCDSVAYVSFPIGGGQKLKSLFIWDCKKLLERELDGGVENTLTLINSSMKLLENVVIMDWPNLISLNELGSFGYLTTLRITECPNLESFPHHELPHVTSLTCLEIQKCTNMDASFPGGLWPPKLSFLGIGGLKKPISGWGPQYFPTSLHSLLLSGGPYDTELRNFDQLSHLLPSSLNSLIIEEFEKVESVSMGLQHLTSLQHLEINRCPKTIELPGMLLPSLLSLRIYECPNMKEMVSKGGSYWPHVSHIPCLSTY